jgi:Ion channel
MLPHSGGVMPWLALLGAGVIALVLWDAFETIILPRRVTRRFRLTRLFYRNTWIPWSKAARLLSGSRRESYLGFYGPLSLLFLLAVWAAGLIVGFGLVHSGVGTTLSGGLAPEFSKYLYLSGETFFTLGYGDVIAVSPFGRALSVIEAGMGFGFLAVVVGYLPVLYQSFSRREVTISLLDARAGSPPTAAELLRRHADDHGMEALCELLHDWERWSAELLESHLSYPVLSYFRSQHSNQSWLAALTALLDTSAFAMVALDGRCQRQARLTFAMARHAVVDLAQIFKALPKDVANDRLSPQQLAEIRASLQQLGLKLQEGDQIDARLHKLRGTYEPYVTSLADYLHLTLPPWVRTHEKRDNWQSTAWGGREAGD